MRTAKSTRVGLVVLLSVLAVGLGAWLASAAGGPAAPTISSGPATPTNQTSASFTYSDSQAVTRFQCSLDGASYADCGTTRPSSKGYSGLAAGSHTFNVRALSGSSTSSATSYSWVIDLTPPTLSAVNRVGPNPTNGSLLVWVVVFSEPVSNVVASNFGLATANVTGAPTIGSVVPLGGSPPQSVWAVTASTAGMTGQNNGSVGLNLVTKGSIRDAAGNVLGTNGFTGQAYTFDTTRPPAPAITARPANPANQDSATFAFGDSEADASFLCKVDGGSYAPCTSPKTYHGLADGSHTFFVLARDTAGNVSASAATFTWTIDTTPPPAPAITGHPSDPSTSTSATFTFADSEAGAGYQCQLDKGTWAGCTSPIAYNGLGVGGHKFQVRAYDAAGNQSNATSFSWRVAQGSGQPFTISGDVNATTSGLLYPGGPARTIPIRLTNPNSVAIFVTAITVSARTTDLPAGCPAAPFALSQSNVSSVAPVQVPANGSVTLPAQGVSAPTIALSDASTNQDACKGATFHLDYSGSAHS